MNVSIEKPFAATDLVPVVVPIIFTLVTLCGLIGNLLVVVVIAVNQTMRDSTNTLIINLAISDLMFVLLCVPFTAVVYATSVWPFHALWCSVVTYLQHVSAWSSVWTLAFMAFDRFMAVVYPIKAIRLRSVQNATIICALTWLVICTLNTPILFMFRTYDYEFGGENRTTCLYLGLAVQTASVLQVRTFFYGFVFGAFCLPLGVTCLLYFWMIKRLWKNPFKNIDRLSEQKPRRKFSVETLRVKRKVVKMILIVTVAFAVCWFPQNLRFMIQAMNYPPGNTTTTTEGHILFGVSAQVLAYANSCLNPILYGLLSENFRKGFKNLIRLIFSKNPQHILRGSSDRPNFSFGSRNNSRMTTPRTSRSRQSSVHWDQNSLLSPKQKHSNYLEVTSSTTLSPELIIRKNNKNVQFEFNALDKVTAL